MGELGQPLGITGLSKIENGKRGVDLDELVAMAKALGVPPLALLFPLGHERLIELFPGVSVQTWDAAKWFSGEAHFPGSDDDVGETAPARFREQDRLVLEWARLNVMAMESRRKFHEEADRPDRQEVWQEQAEWADNAANSLGDQLRRHRSYMRKDGLDPGPLPRQLAHLEDGDDGER
jgi:transcriptional regulator with XRE-family HTH domain